MLLRDCNTLEDISHMAHMVDKETLWQFFLSTSLLLPHDHATNVLYTFSHLLLTVHEMERLYVSENGCSTPKCS
jgi:hypothetical protein